jgi:hypothetical protein
MLHLNQYSPFLKKQLLQMQLIVGMYNDVLIPWHKFTNKKGVLTSTPFELKLK